MDATETRPDTLINIEESPRQTFVENEPREFSLFGNISSVDFVANIVENFYFIVFMTMLTIWSLFGNNIKLTSTPKSADIYFEVVISFIFFAYLIEMLLTIYSKPEYIKWPNWKKIPRQSFCSIQGLKRRFIFGSFYFWCDLLACASLLFEMSWVFPSLTFDFDAVTAGLAATRGSRTGRTLRLISVFSLVRVERLFKYVSILSKPEEERRNKSGYNNNNYSYFNNNNNNSASNSSNTLHDINSNKSANQVSINNNNNNTNNYSNSSRSTTYGNNNNNNNSTGNDDNYVHQSHVGSKMSDLTNQRVLVLVFSLLVAIPAFSVNQTDITSNLATRMLFQMAFLNATSTTNVYQEGLLLAIDNVLLDTTALEINFITNGKSYIYFQDTRTINELRNQEIITYYESTTFRTSSSSSSQTFKTELKFNIQDVVKETSLFSIYTTIFFIGLLLSGAFLLSYDINKLVIVPIERMVELVKKISENPLAEYKDMGKDEGFREGLETTILLTTITKIGRLMRVGFGEAGASVIAKNLAESSGGKLTLVGPGTLIHSIFGFCDIRQFTDTTECLQEEVMLFVNRIAHILHGIVVQCSGQANKNIGDAFLLTWKIDESQYGTATGMSLADQALIAFLRTLVELIRHEDFIVNFSATATAKLYKRFPGYNVRIGCGLHYGWAIEGAIGSHRKIDASYLSPHVNFTEFLESSTKAYGVPLLMSEPFYKMLSPTASKYCRQVDRILRSESQGPIGLYTYDADLLINFSDYARKRLHPIPRKNLMGAATVTGPRPAPLVRSHTGARVAREINTSRHSENSSSAAVGTGSGNSQNNSNATNSNATTLLNSNKYTNLIFRNAFFTNNADNTNVVDDNSSHCNSNNTNHNTTNTVLNPITSSNNNHNGSSSSGHGGIKSNNNTNNNNNNNNNNTNTNTLTNNNSSSSSSVTRNAPEIKLPPYSESLWDTDDDLLELRHKFNPEFTHAWGAGIANYINGKWGVASKYFKETLELTKGTDGPSKFLLEFMSETNYEAPDEWQEYRIEGTG